MHVFERPIVHSLPLEDDPAALRLALESADVGVFELDDRGELRRFSERAAAIWGLERGGRLDRKRLLALAHPDDRPRLQQALALLIDQFAGTARVEYRLCRDSGAERWIELRGQRHVGAGAARVVGSVRDITQRHTHLIQKQRSIETLREVSEQSPFGTYVLHSRLRFLYASKEARRTLATVPNLIGTTIHDALRTLWPEPTASRYIACFEHTLVTGEPCSAARTVERRADSLATEACDWRIERLTLPDGQFGVVCHYYDLTREFQLEAQIKARERHLHLIAETAPAMLAHADRNCRYRFVNRAYAARFDRNAGALIRSRRPDVLGEQRFERVRHFVEAALIASQASPSARFGITSVGIVQVDSQSLRFVQTNEAFQALTGYSEEELRSLTVLDITHPEDRERDAGIMTRLGRGEIEGYEIGKRYLNRSGDTAWAHSTANLIRDETGEPRVTYPSCRTSPDARRTNLNCVAVASASSWRCSPATPACSNGGCWRTKAAYRGFFGTTSAPWRRRVASARRTGRASYTRTTS